MKRLLILIVLVLAGCVEQTPEEIYKRVQDSGTITDRQAEILSEGRRFVFDVLTSITDQQAEILSKLTRLSLDGLTSITDEQAENLSKVKGHLTLSGLTSINDQQAAFFSNGDYMSLQLDGLTSITNKQAESLSKVEVLTISDILQPLIDKYKNQ